MSVSQSCTRVPALLKLDILQGLENAELAFNTVLAADSWLCRWHVVFVLQFWDVLGHMRARRERESQSQSQTQSQREFSICECV